jgi:MoaA/NifB/PqqE/SkfB family radical SAM enzyme
MDLTADSGTQSGSSTLMLHLLGRCNLTCLHCYMDGSPSRRENITIATVLQTIAECRGLGIGTLFLTGGEPLLYPELEEALEAAARVPGLSVTVCTNAMLMTPRRAASLHEAGAEANVSIDGEPRFHDYFRNLNGAFRGAEKGVRNLVDAGVSVTIITTLSQGNLGSLRSTARWAADIGATTLRVQPLLSLGRGVRIADERLTEEQVDHMLLELSDIGNEYRARGLTCKVIGVTRRFLLAHPCGAYVCNGTGCHRRVAKEIKKLVIREDGTVLPEVTNLSQEYALGNIADAPLSALVDRYFEQGYERFDALCRAAYDEILPTWTSALVPWDQIIADRSRRAVAHNQPPAESGCGSTSCCTLKKNTTVDYYVN